ncbi:MAG: hypothetical protein ABI743_05640 [bacterium]
MMRLRTALLAALTLPIALSACSHNGTAVDQPVDRGQTTPPVTIGLFEGSESIVGVYDLTVDPTTMTATLAPAAVRAAQGPQALSYDLDIARFLKSDSLDVTSVTRDGNGDLSIGFVQRHPFPAPNFASPVSGSNRADLGYTGRLLILADLASGEVPSNTWFGNVTANPRLVQHPDGFVNPGDLLRTTGLTTNTFPYMLLADEAKDNRVGVPNGGPTGNYVAAGGGWQQFNAGPNGDGWVGYDYIHGGQAVANSFTLSASELMAQAQTIQLAVLIKYTDPRGLTGRTRRFPVLPADPLQFAYRLPYAALDASVVSVSDDLDVDSLSGGSDDLDIDVRDWDASATEAPGSTLEGEPQVDLIQAGASGAPTVLFDCPPLFNTPASIAATGDGTGLPGDELEYDSLVVNALGTAPVGDCVGLLRVTDPESGDSAQADYHFGVDPDDLSADPARAIKPETFQVVQIHVTQSTLAPVIQSVSPAGGGPCEQVQFSAVATNNPTSWSWDFSTGAVPGVSVDEEPLETLQGLGTYNGTVTAVNAGGASAPFPFSYTVAPDAQPSWTSHFIIPLTSISNEVDYTTVVVHNGKLAVGFNSGNGGVPAVCCDMMIAQSTIPLPSASTDWVVTTVDASGFQGQNNSLVDFQGRLVMAWNDATNGDLRMALANTVTPNGEGDWLKYNIDTIGITGYETDVQDVNGYLGVSYCNSGGGLRFARATAVAPTVSDWVKQTVDSTASCGYDADMTVLNGKAAIAHRNLSTGDFRLAQALTTTPSSGSDWRLTVIEAAGTSTSSPGFFNGTSLAIATTNGRLAVVYDDTTIKTLTFNLATLAEPLGTSDWTRYNLDPVGDYSGDLDLISSHGRLVIAYRADADPTPSGSGDLKVARALTCNPLTLADWGIQVADAGTGATDVAYLPGITVSNGRFVIAHRVQWGLQATISTGTW